jgi:hypothetical protein
VTFFENRAVYEIMSNNMVVPEDVDNMAPVRGILDTQASTRTHTFLILVTLHGSSGFLERVSVLRYTYIAAHVGSTEEHCAPQMAQGYLVLSKGRTRERKACVVVITARGVVSYWAIQPCQVKLKKSARWIAVRPQTRLWEYFDSSDARNVEVSVSLSSATGPDV